MRSLGWAVVLTLAALGRSNPALAQLVELEPNNTAATANALACGDTIVCASLPGGDTDVYSVALVAGDSLVAFTFNCAGSATNTVLTLSNAADSLLALDNDGGEAWFSCVRWRAAASGEYFLAVYRPLTPPDSTYSLTVVCPQFAPEDYDRCETPRIISTLPYFDESGTTRGMTNQCGSPAPDVFYRFQNPAPGTLRVEVCTNQFNARVQLLQGCCANYLDDADEGCGLGATLIVYHLPPGDYSLLVEGTTATAAGPFSLEVTATLPDCPVPGPVVLATIGGLPLLDWPEVDGPAYYVIWQCPAVNGIWEHVGTTFFTYFTDSTGFTSPRRFYYVSAVCLW